jgi:large subunit ribosomal protein L21
MCSHYHLAPYPFNFMGSTNFALSMPYAIIKTGGKQFRVEPGRTYRIPSLVGEAGSDVEFNEVLLGSDGDNVRTGVPMLQGARVTGEIVKHGRGEKIIVFKHKRRKNYARKRGHRQGFTEVRINDISLG